MTETFNVRFTGDFLSVPPDDPVISIPAHGLDEALPVNYTAEDSPEAKVDAFLEDNAVLFEVAHGAWAGVRAAQTAYRLTLDGFQYRNGDKRAGSANRHQRRAVTSILGDFASAGTMFAMSKHFADSLYPSFVEGLTDLEQDQPVFVGSLDDYVRRHMKQINDREVVSDEPEEAGFMNLMKRTESISAAITVANMYAMYRQDIALSKIGEFLADASVAPAFVQRVIEIAGDHKRHEAHTGLLEIIATHIKMADRDNMVISALQKSMPDQLIGAREFMRAVGAKKERLPKELSAALGVMEIAAGIVDCTFSLDRESFLDLFADRVEEWPPELKNQLQNYMLSRVMQSWAGFWGVLSPFVRNGRLPVQTTSTTITPSGLLETVNRPRRGAVGAPAHTNSRRDAVKVPLVRGAAAYSEDVGAETERQPIPRFGVLSGKGDKASRRFDLISVDDVDQIFAFSNLDAYIEKYAGDVTVRPMLVAAVAHLLTEWRDPSCTKQLTAVTYDLILGGDTVRRDRHPWRFSPQYFPGIKKGTIATKTRLIYDVVRIGGERTLVVYGAFLKDDVERMNSMPRIREN